jgi:hypothetical protein
MNPELQYIIELIRRAPRDYQVKLVKDRPDTVVLKCPDGTYLKISKEIIK